MKKVFSILLLSSFFALSNAQVTYEVGDPQNDKAMSIAIDESEEVSSSVIPFNISLTDPQQDITAVAFYFSVPEGAKWPTSKRKLYSTSEERAENHDVSTVTVTNKADTDHYGMLLVSVYNSDATDDLYKFQGTEGVVVTFNLDCSDLADGTYEIQFVDPEAVNPEGDTFKCEGSSYTFSITDGVVTGINSISVDAQNAKYYSVNGAIQNGPQKGVNIVKYADGKVKKVIIK